MVVRFEVWGERGRKLIAERKCTMAGDASEWELENMHGSEQ